MLSANNQMPAMHAGSTCSGAKAGRASDRCLQKRSSTSATSTPYAAATHALRARASPAASSKAAPVPAHAVP